MGREKKQIMVREVPCLKMLEDQLLKDVVTSSGRLLFILNDAMGDNAFSSSPPANFSLKDAICCNISLKLQAEL